MDIKTDHQIVTFGNNMMMLFNADDGAVLVTADRAGDTWTIKAAGSSDATATGREAAVTAMTERALAILPGTGYSTLVPHSLWDLP